MDPAEAEESGVPSFYWVAETYTKPEYEHAMIHFYVPGTLRLDDAGLEEVVIHELNHVLLSEAKIKDHDREEHVVTLLSRAFQRVCQS